MLAPSFIEPGTVIHMQSENGVIGVGVGLTINTL